MTANQAVFSISTMSEFDLSTGRQFLDVGSTDISEYLILISSKLLNNINVLPIYQDNITEDKLAEYKNMILISPPILIQKHCRQSSDELDGTRILVMRFWPRGVRKSHFDEWHRDLAPSAELLKWCQANRGQLDHETFTTT